MKDRIEWTRMVSDCITGYRSARGDADAMPPRSFIRAWMNRNFGLQKIPGRLFRLFYRSDKEELNEAFRAGNRARKKETAQDTVQSVDNLQAQINLFEEQTGEKLKIKNGRPYYRGDLELTGCEDLTSLPQGLLVKGDLMLVDCIGLTSLPSGLTVEKWLVLDGCTITSLPSGLTVGDSLQILETDFVSLPADLTFTNPGGFIVGIPESLVPFIKKLNFESYDKDAHCITTEEWMSKRHLVSQMDEAFRAGNRARKQESAADTVQGTEDASPRGQLTRWANAIVKAVDEASAESSIWTADEFSGNIEIADSPSYDFYEHTKRVDCWSGCIDDFNIDFENGYVAGYIFIYVPVNPEDGYAFSIGGACDGEDVNESYNTYNTLEEAISGSIEEIIDCIEYWNKEVTERNSGYDDDDIDEAFRAGNRARKKESAADAAQGSFEELHYSDIPILNTQMNRLRDLVSPDDVKNIGGDAIAFGIDIPCDFEFYFNISIYPLEKTGIYSIHVMFTVEGLETYMYDGDEVDSWDLEYVFDRIVDAVEHPEKFEEYRAGGYEKMYG